MPYWFFAEKLSSYINMACCPSPSTQTPLFLMKFRLTWFHLGYALLCTSIIEEVSTPLRKISPTVCSGNSKAKLYRFIRRVGKAFCSPWAVLLQSSVCWFFSFLCAWTDWAILLTANQKWFWYVWNWTGKLEFASLFLTERKARIVYSEPRWEKCSSLSHTILKLNV